MIALRPPTTADRLAERYLRFRTRVVRWARESPRNHAEAVQRWQRISLAAGMLAEAIEGHVTEAAGESRQ